MGPYVNIEKEQSQPISQQPLGEHEIVGLLIEVFDPFNEKKR